MIPSCSHCPASSYLVNDSSYLANSFSIKFSLLNPHVSSLSWEECDRKMDSKGFTESKLARSKGLNHTVTGGETHAGPSQVQRPWGLGLVCARDHQKACASGE